MSSEDRLGQAIFGDWAYAGVLRAATEWSVVFDVNRRNGKMKRPPEYGDSADTVDTERVDLADAATADLHRRAVR